MPKVKEEIVQTVDFPRNTTPVLGMDTVMTHIKRAFASPRPPQSWLFYGAMGIGKATFAYHVARYILADSDEAMTNMNHRVFRQVSQMSHPDLHVIERDFDEKKETYAAEIKIDAIRSLHSFLALTPSQSKRRVVLIDGVDTLTISAMNALLKSLEEPPSTTFFLLTCHNKEKLLPTVLSRCLNVPIHGLSNDHMKQILKTKLSTLDDDTIALLATYAHGSPGKAIQLAQHYALDILPSLATMLQDLPKISLQSIHHLVDQLSGTKKPEIFLHTVYLLYTLVSRSMLVKHHGESFQIFEIEKPFFNNAYLMSSPDRALLWLDEVSRMLTNPATGHMDKRMLFIYLFEKLRQI